VTSVAALGDVHSHVGAAQQRVGVGAVIGRTTPMPMLASISSSNPPSANGSSRFEPVARRWWCASSTVAVGSSTANSSPPRRAMVSEPRKTLASGCPVAPAADRGVCQRVVDFFEAIQVHDQQPTAFATALRGADRLLESIVQQDAIGRSVSASCSAWCSRAASACLRAVISRTLKISKWFSFSASRRLTRRREDGVALRRPRVCLGQRVEQCAHIAADDVHGGVADKPAPRQVERRDAVRFVNRNDALGDVVQHARKWACWSAAPAAAGRCVNGVPGQGAHRIQELAIADENGSAEYGRARVTANVVAGTRKECSSGDRSQRNRLERARRGLAAPTTPGSARRRQRSARAGFSRQSDR